ncbi:MAG: glycosyltransferase family 2 protein [Flavobacteriaceae bacterium]|nr:glycosyltransferase family 2 protein [Flavobacteriaceae bacterium]
MLSILIPIYNYNAYPLVLELHKQCLECKIDFEILCQDDASKSVLNSENDKINSLSNCNFTELKVNIAHRQNRNSLANKAKFENLLFIDGDSIIIRNNYISNYVSWLNDFDIIYGGRLHPENFPSNNQKLRWKYGKFIEDKSVEKRKLAPFQSLLFNNTIIKKDCFNKVKFDSHLTKYGHDDTQLSFQLSQFNPKLIHVDNPVEHGDIDSNIEYILKTKSSLENLIKLFEEGKINKDFSRLILLLLILNKMKLTYLIFVFYKISEGFLSRNLEGNNPNLFIYNIFKLGYLCSISIKK